MTLLSLSAEVVIIYLTLKRLVLILLLSLSLHHHFGAKLQIRIQENYLEILMERIKPFSIHFKQSQQKAVLERYENCFLPKIGDNDTEANPKSDC